MHSLTLAALWIQCGAIIILSWFCAAWERRAYEAVDLAKRFGQQRDALAHFLSLQGWQVDMTEGSVRIWWPEGDPEEERLRR